jgi:large subunit ribosomal protein LP2
MRYVAAYMLAVLGGNKAPTEEDLKKILASVDVEYNPEQSKKVVSELSGKNLDELIAQGSEKLATIPAGGGGGGSAAAAGGSGAGESAKAEEKKEEKKEEEEEEDEDMGFSLFD